MNKNIINDNGKDREMTAKEQAEFDAWSEISKTENEAQATARTERQALKVATLTKLGLTADEVAALLS